MLCSIITLPLIEFDRYSFSLDEAFIVLCSIGISITNRWLDVERRYYYLILMSLIDNWHSDLDGMNEGKEGAVAYRYPDSFICSTSWLYGSLFSSTI